MSSLQNTSVALVSAFLVAACGETAPPTPPAVEVPVAAVPSAPAPAAVAPVAAAVAAAVVAPTAEAVVLAGPGFTFAPVTGTAGGPTDGEQMGEGCIGSFPTAPQHTVALGAVVPRLRLLVNGGAADTTIAVRTPDGRTLCNDDSGDPGNSLNPALDIENAPAGAYQIFVGGYSSGDSWSAYRLGLSETADAMPSVVVPAP